MRKKIKKDLRKKVWKKYNLRCAYCGDKLEYKKMQVDHIIAQCHYSHEFDCLIVNGKKFRDHGVDDIQNLNPSCRMCNKWKGSYNLNQFRKEIQMQIEKLSVTSPGFRLAFRYGLVQFNKKKVKFYFESFKYNKSKTK